MMDAIALQASDQDPSALKNTQELPREIEAAILKHDGRQFKIEQRQGWGATTGGLELTKRSMVPLTAAVFTSLSQALLPHSAEAKMLKVVSGLDHDVIALAIIQTALHSLARQEDQTRTALAVGAALSGECWAANLTKADLAIPGTTSLKLTPERIAKSVTRRYSTVKGRFAAAKVLAAKNGFTQREWSQDLKVRAGTWGLNILVDTLPHVFRWRSESVPTRRGLETTRYLEITEGAWDTVDAILANTINSRPVWFCSLTPPKPWDAWSGCGSSDARVNGVTTFLRTRFKGTGAAVRAAIKSGAMQPAMDGLNAVQGTAWAMNPRVLGVIRECAERGIPVKGLPPTNVIAPKPVRMSNEEWLAMDAGARRLQRMRKDELRLLASAAACDRVMFVADMVQAEELAWVERFYTPMNCDWRGRIYSLSHFCFAREDRVRALFQFADGEPIGAEGLRWLKIHLANCGDFNKISKRTLEEREQWTTDNLTAITSCATDPMGTSMWRDADKPFLFLAACLELASALDVGSHYITRLPVSFDGSCSGLQHLSAMTRASEGALVNLTPSDLPQDIYEAVAAITRERLTEDLTLEAEDPSEEAEKAASLKRALARICLDHGITRSVVKRNVMTYAYSSKKFGMACQLQTDLMKPMAREVLEGKLVEHPFAPYHTGTEERPSPAARYLSNHVFGAIETKVRKPSEAMKYLQKLAKAMAHESKPLAWVTPVGIPWINRYHDPITKRVELWLNDGGVRVRSQLTVAVGDQPEINKEKAANGVAPNFVHALDAAHLLRVARASHDAGIRSIATVHDSFGCLAPRATQFNKIIREEFARMYEEHDVLAEVLAQATHDLTDCNSDRMPTAIEYGTLNLKDILSAEFAFS